VGERENGRERGRETGLISLKSRVISFLQPSNVTDVGEYCLFNPTTSFSGYV
jgi:hypothetical protein